MREAYCQHTPIFLTTQLSSLLTSSSKNSCHFCIHVPLFTADIPLSPYLISQLSHLYLPCSLHGCHLHNPLPSFTVIISAPYLFFLTAVISAFPSTVVPSESPSLHFTVVISEPSFLYPHFSPHFPHSSVSQL